MKKKFKNIFNNFQDAYFEADRNGKFTLVGPAALQMYGYNSESELIGLAAENLYADQQVERTTSIIIQHTKYTGFCNSGKTKRWICILGFNERAKAI